MRHHIPSRSGEHPAATLDHQLSALASKTTAELKRKWRTLFGSAPPPLTRDLLARVIAHRMQEQHFGGLDRKLVNLLGEISGKRAPRPRLKIGSVLVREYADVLHEATVAENGFRWQGQIYPSLSAVARAITGTSWNGLRFFGVSKRAGSSLKGRGL